MIRAVLAIALATVAMQVAAVAAYDRFILIPQLDAAAAHHPTCRSHPELRRCVRLHQRATS